MNEQLPHDLVPLHEPPRATRLSLVHRPEVDVEIWIGGTRSLLGEPITAADLEEAVVVDCSGELPDQLRARAWRYEPRVFVDLETVPAAYPRIAALVHELAGAVACAGETGGAPRPRRIYLLCQQGMNRSGLVAGLLLRALGEPAARAIALIRAERPGALNNPAFAGLIERWSCPAAATAP